MCKDLCLIYCTFHVILGKRIVLMRNKIHTFGTKFVEKLPILSLYKQDQHFWLESFVIQIRREAVDLFV